MDKYSIKLSDIRRILQGEVPLEFYVELMLRGLFVYLLLVFSFRLMGKRMASRMTRNELAAVATLAAAVGIPLQTPERGLLPGLLIAGIVILVQRGVAARAAKRERFERATQGKISTLVEDACIQVDDLKECHLSRERIFSQLRSSSILHLGQVERLYLEANGSFTLVKKEQAIPGLCVLPEVDAAFIREQTQEKDKLVCHYCGCAKKQGTTTCSNCKGDQWVVAIK